MGRSVIVVALGLALGAAACVTLAGLSEDDVPAPADAGTEAGGPSDVAAPVDPCRHALPLSEPLADDDPSGAVPSFVLAVREIALGGALDGGMLRGFDLDGVCSCFEDPATAHGGLPSCVAPDGGAPACDGVGGADRQLGTLLGAYPNALAAGNGSAGGPTLLLKITGYNGRANDKEVFVALVASPGIYDATGCYDAGVDAGSPPLAPTWRGCDRWTLDPDYLFPGTSEPLTSLPAYVVDHVLVLRPTTKPTNFVVGAVAFPIANTLLTGRLVAIDDDLVPIEPLPQVGTKFRLDDAVIAGRVSTTNMLEVLAASQALMDGGPLCGFPNFFNTVKRGVLCPGADMAPSPDLDFTNAPCQAFSLATAFRAEPAQAGGRRMSNPRRCADPKAPENQAFFDCNR